MHFSPATTIMMGSWVQQACNRGSCCGSSGPGPSSCLESKWQVQNQLTRHCVSQKVVARLHALEPGLHCPDDRQLGPTSMQYR